MMSKWTRNSSCSTRSRDIRFHCLIRAHTRRFVCTNSFNDIMHNFLWLKLNIWSLTTARALSNSTTRRLSRPPPAPSTEGSLISSPIARKDRTPTAALWHGQPPRLTVLQLQDWPARTPRGLITVMIHFSFESEAWSKCKRARAAPWYA